MKVSKPFFCGATRPYLLATCLMWELHSLRTHQISNLAFIPRPMDGGFLMLLHWGGSSSESGASGSELVLQCGTGMWPCVSLPQLVPKHPPTHTQLTPGMLAHSRHKLLADFSHIVTRWFVNYWECNRSASLIPTTHLLHYPCGRFFFFTHFVLSHVPPPSQ